MPETPEMVEAVARAIYGVSAEPEHGETWEALTEVWRDNLRLHARAAIQAMRVPTEAMRYAVWHDQYVTCGGEPHLADALARKKVADPIQREQDLSSFSALIDAALAAPEEGRES